ncbi:hypothetical protein GCM10022267_50090 [Lentzea roselyniae]|uniref:Uncharacterized protein n=1 Tax=Lentzea roselyniae TaxID=531940 RepID=A0ABP7BFZ1_9PSEU
MTRRFLPAANDPGQIDLFSGNSIEAAATVLARQAARAFGFGGKPDLAAELLAEIRDGRYGRLDHNDRIVRIEPGERCRYAPDAEAEVAESLLTQRFARLGPVLPLRHGAITREVHRLTLTPGGNGLLERWSALRIRRPR